MRQVIESRPDSTNGYVGTELQIGGGRFGVKPLAQHGTIFIKDGYITLLNTGRQVAARAPIAQCSASKTPWYLFSDGAWLTMEGVRYFVRITYFGSPDKPAQVGQSKREATRKFLDVLASMNTKVQGTL